MHDASAWLGIFWPQLLSLPPRKTWPSKFLMFDFPNLAPLGKPRIFKEHHFSNDPWGNCGTLRLGSKMFKGSTSCSNFTKMREGCNGRKFTAWRAGIVGAMLGSVACGAILTDQAQIKQLPMNMYIYTLIVATPKMIAKYYPPSLAISHPTCNVAATAVVGILRYGW